MNYGDAKYRYCSKNKMEDVCFDLFFVQPCFPLEWILFYNLFIQNLISLAPAILIVVGGMFFVDPEKLSTYVITLGCAGGAVPMLSAYQKNMTLDVFAIWLTMGITALERFSSNNILSPGFGFKHLNNIFSMSQVTLNCCMIARLFSLCAAYNVAFNFGEVIVLFVSIFTMILSDSLYQDWMKYGNRSRVQLYPNLYSRSLHRNRLIYTVSVSIFQVTAVGVVTWIYDSIPPQGAVPFDPF